MKENEQQIERSLEALCDELYWGLRYFYACKALYQSELRLTPTLFDTFYFSCLDQACLILSRLVIPHEDSVSFEYFFEIAKKKQKVFRFAEPGEITTKVKTHLALLESYSALKGVLKGQRDQNLAHLDRKHVNQPDWQSRQIQLDLDLVEKFYGDLISVATTYYKMYYGGDLEFADWGNISQEEVKTLIDFYNGYRPNS